jgi:hypothetical protein
MYGHKRFDDTAVTGTTASAVPPEDGWAAAAEDGRTPSAWEAGATGPSARDSGPRCSDGA